MKLQFALVNGIKTEATKGARGICPCCGSEMVAKCGTVRIKHWAHKQGSECDVWWENQTEWHLKWKNKFHVEWQEYLQIDRTTGERHIADVRSPQGIVIEFQHSHINPQERISRERFYKNMVWVVDGTRLKNDYKRFAKNIKSNLRSAEVANVFIVSFPEECFPSNWLASLVPVIFDFRGMESVSDTDDLRGHLFCLFHSQSMPTLLLKISEDFFVKSITNGEWSELVTEANNLRRRIQARSDEQRRKDDAWQWAQLMKYARMQRGGGRRF